MAAVPRISCGLVAAASPLSTARRNARLRCAPTPSGCVTRAAAGSRGTTSAAGGACRSRCSGRNPTDALNRAPGEGVAPCPAAPYDLPQMTAPHQPLVSIVLPVKNEAGNIGPLVEEIGAALAGRWPFEVI